MSELKRESSETAMPIHEKWSAWVDRNAGNMLKRKVTESIAEKYDALDYRLMATFPASDAVARY